MFGGWSSSETSAPGEFSSEGTFSCMDANLRHFSYILNYTSLNHFGTIVSYSTPQSGMQHKYLKITAIINSLVKLTTERCANASVV
jgi:hypothetical protein